MSRRRNLSFAFTLVEMLVVLAIIGVLAAILVPVLASAIRKANNAAIALELEGLVGAVTAYRNDHNDFFPDGTNHEALVLHLRTAFPRIPNHQTYVNNWLSAGGNQMDPAEALVFFLRNIGKNPRDPFGSSGTATSRFEFDETRLRDEDNDTFPEYYPKTANQAPYVYFDGRVQEAINGAARTTTSAYAWAIYPLAAPTDSAYLADDLVERQTTRIPGAPTGGSAIGIVRPYRSSTVTGDATTWPAGNAWMEAGKFQVICAGLDNDFGPDYQFKAFPDPDYQISPEDSDNIASFADGKTIGDSVP